jgi:nucleoside 2-deoxyribosyltransferase
MIKSIYLIGSLRNPKIPEIGNHIRQLGIEAFEDWFSAGYEADDKWQAHEKLKGRSYGEALKGHAARHVFAFDKFHLDRVDAAVLVMPGGKSSHLELGYMVGKGKPAYVLFNGEPERWDCMYQFATAVFFDLNDLLEELKCPRDHSSATSEVRENSASSRNGEAKSRSTLYPPENLRRFLAE